MKIIKLLKYTIEFLIIVIFFLFFKILGVKRSSYISGKIFNIIGPLFRSKNTINHNLKTAVPEATDNEIKNYTKEMWNYYGKVLAEYLFLKDFRNNTYIKINGNEILDSLKKNNENVIFISGHFDNFELMAMALDKAKIKVAAIYRPLNNFYLNKIIVYLRKKYVCENQIKKGRSSVRQIVRMFKNGYSLALMIDQRVSEGIKSPFFKKEAHTTTIPAQFIKKFNCKVVPIYIERKSGINFVIEILKPIKFQQNESVDEITAKLNYCLEKMILKKPSKWIWTHNRWK